MKEKSHKWDAELYAKNSSRQYQLAMELIEKLNLKGNESVLDIGCGDGKITAFISSKLPNGTVVGIDSSEEMISYAKQQFPSSKHPNLSFVCVSATELKFENKFDIAFSISVLNWIKDQETVLTGVNKALKKNGRILFQMSGKGMYKKLLANINKLIQQEKWKAYFKDFVFPWFYYSPEEYRPWLEKAGLKINRIELITKDLTYKGKKDLIDFITVGWGIFTQKVPENKRQTFILKFAESYLETYPLDKNGILHIDAIRLEVDAIKI